MKAHLMTQQQFCQLHDYLKGQDGCNFVDALHTAEGIDWDCDGTLKLTRQWLKKHNLPVEANVAALEACGGYCDCEVVFNVGSHWADYLIEQQG